MTVPYLRLVTVGGAEIQAGYSEVERCKLQQLAISIRHQREEAASQHRYWLSLHSELPKSAEAELMLALAEYGIAKHMQTAEFLERVRGGSQFDKAAVDHIKALTEKAAAAFSRASDLMAEAVGIDRIA